MNSLARESSDVADPPRHVSARHSQSFELIALDEWQGFVDSHPDSTPLHHRNWIELLVEQYGFEILLPAMRRDGRIIAAAVFLASRSLLGSRKIISVPFTDCFTPLSWEPNALCQLMEWFAAHVGSDVKLISMRTDRTLDGFPLHQRWVRHRIRLTPEMSDLLPLLPHAVRRNIRQARSHGLEFEACTDWQSVKDFYRLHVMTRRKLGLPVQTRGFYDRLHHFTVERGLGSVAVVRSAGEPIAAAILLQYNGSVIYKYGASDPRMLGQRPNDFLFYNAIESAARGCQYFDFGVTHIDDDGLRRFKRKWGADEEPIYDVCIAGQMRGFAGDLPAFKLASAMIRWSPRFFCRALGHVFYKYSV